MKKKNNTQEINGITMELELDGRSSVFFLTMTIFQRMIIDLCLAAIAGGVRGVVHFWSYRRPFAKIEKTFTLVLLDRRQGS